MVSTKVDLNHNRLMRVHDLDELAPILFPGNRNHQRVFLAIFVEIKWADGQFLPVLEPIMDKYGLSRRVLETVRAKMRRLGFIDRVSRFNKKYGYREGWVFSNRFTQGLNQLADFSEEFRQCNGPVQEKKDKELFKYV